MRLLPLRFKEDRYPKDADGRPDAARYTDPIDYYLAMYERYLAALPHRRGRGINVDRAFKCRVHAVWGLIAKADEAVPHAMALLRHRAPQAREDGAAILGELGRDDAIVDRLLASLGAETDATARDTLVLALGRCRSRRAIPALAAIVRDEAADCDTRWTAVESLGRIVGRRFLAQPNPVAAALEWLARNPPTAPA